MSPSVANARADSRNLYNYVDLVQLRVVARLRKQGASLQKIRRAVSWLRDEVEAREDWHTKTLTLTDSGIVAFLESDEAYEASSKHQGQRRFHIFLGDVQDDLTQVGRELGIGERVTIDPAVQGGSPIVRNTRLPTAFLAGLLDEGQSAEEVASHYPGLEAADVHAAREFEVRLRAVG